MRGLNLCMTLVSSDMPVVCLLVRAIMTSEVECSLSTGIARNEGTGTVWGRERVDERGIANPKN